MAVRGRRASRLLAHHTQEVSRHTKGGETSLMDLIERDLARRAEHVAAIAVIDGELGRVYDRLGQDRPAYVPPSPSPVRPSPEAAPASVAAATATSPGAGAGSATARRRSSSVDGATATVIASVLDAVRAGHETPGAIRACVERSGHAAWRVKGALQFCVVQGTLRLSGRTSASRYTLASEHARPAVVAARAVVDDGVEFEPVWTGAKSDPSLLGDRASRGSVLGASR